mmetsp:Transcript_11107/g.21992  ORF Transcript_11107/g.21992 Transcript_11107/m.21992 type:complete len:630 (-) Transcript_11107:287-2176(-)
MACCTSLLARRIMLWYILLGSLVIVPLTLNVGLGCRFMNIIETSSSFQQAAVIQGLGAFNVAAYDREGFGGAAGSNNFLGCIDYPLFWHEATSNDITFTTTRIATGFLLAFTALATFICIWLQCFSKHGKSHLWNVMKVLYVGALISQGVMYTVFASDVCSTDGYNDNEQQQCSTGSDGIVGAFNFIVLLGMVIATFNSLPPRNPVFQCWGRGDYSDDDDYDDDHDDGSSTTEEDEVMRRFKSFGEVGQKSVSAVDNESVSLFGGSSRMSRKSGKSRKSLKMKMTEEDDIISAAENGHASASGASIGVGASLGANESVGSKSHQSRAVAVNAAGVVPVVGAGARVTTEKEEEAPVANGSVASSKKSSKSAKSIASSKKPKKAKSDAVVVTTVTSMDSASAASGKSGRSGSTLQPYPAKYLPKKNKFRDNDNDNDSESVPIPTARLHLSLPPKTDEIPIDSILSKSSNGSTKSVDVANFISQLVEMTELAEGGRRVKTDEQENQVEIIDEYPNVAGKQIDSSPNSDVVKIRTEYYDMGARTTKEITHQDGSRTIVTTIVAVDPAETQQREAVDAPVEVTNSLGSISAGSIPSVNSSKYRVLNAMSSETPTIFKKSSKDKDRALGQGELNL